ncbi:ring-opening amidohydrolase [Paenibacillus tritici]|uniref:cyanuric acid amidohydrolase n=1 Tax=Paenibacillus tritici TaxID=1873425 RepID=UPI001BA84882|nr:ring-opening amidohydrolase [Paenibacillus tritici]QUL54713.1 ring-opening amidohydrolase [Paenibacillus tritici]
MMKCSVIKIPAGAPHDMSGLKASAEEGLFRPEEVVAVLGKTEGNGCVNDFTRGYAVMALKDFFAGAVKGGAADISYVMSGGTEGVLSPHFTVISRSGQAGLASERERDQDQSQDQEQGLITGGPKSLAIGVARTRDFLPEELGRLSQVDAVAEAVARAVRDAGITSLQDVHFVQIKCPLLTAEQIYDAHSRQVSLVTEDTYKSMGYSRGASALGAAAALGEVERSALREEEIGVNWDKFSRVASTSAGSELACCEVIVFGNSQSAEGPYHIDHAVMQDAIDGAALQGLLDRYPGEELVQVLAKAEADPDGVIRGRRHIMLDDSDINHTRHARAVVGGVLAYVGGDPMIYVSGGGEHQGPKGGGPVAAVFRRR